MPPSESSPKQLLVEGKNDGYVIRALCTVNNTQIDFNVVASDGVEPLLESIPVQVKKADTKILGIVVDADDDLQSRWDTVESKLKLAGYKSLPQKLSVEGLIHSEIDMPTIGVWVMPDNFRSGMIEDFVRLLIPVDDPLRPKVEHILTDIESENIHCYAECHRQKAYIHTWLAWQKTPGLPMGTSITAKVLSPDNEIAKKFLNWLKQLYALA